MDLRWWPLAVAGLAVLLVCVAVAALWPIAPVQRRLRPMAHVDRLTKLPEYGRVDRIQLLALVITGVLLLTVFCAALVTSARPTGMSSTTRDFESKHPEDIMLCVGEPVTDPTTGGFLTYFADQAASFTNQRIGLTSPTLRVVPLTRDHQFAAEAFADYARVPGLQRDTDEGRQMPAEDINALRTGIENFSRSVTYLDYAPGVEDILALCMAGFPGFESKSTHRRSIIYLGFSELRGADETRPALFSAQRIKEMAAAGGIQINVLSRSDVLAPSAETNDALRAIAEESGGTFSLYNPAGTAGDGSAPTEPTLARDLDRIRANPPSVVLPGGTSVSLRSWDYPNVPLIVSLSAAILLCISLAVLRR